MIKYEFYFLLSKFVDLRRRIWAMGYLSYPCNNARLKIIFGINAFKIHTDVKR